MQIVAAAFVSRKQPSEPDWHYGLRVPLFFRDTGLIRFAFKRQPIATISSPRRAPSVYRSRLRRFGNIVVFEHSTPLRVEYC